MCVCVSSCVWGFGDVGLHLSLTLGVLASFSGDSEGMICATLATSMSGRSLFGYQCSDRSSMLSSARKGAREVAGGPLKLRDASSSRKPLGENGATPKHSEMMRLSRPEAPNPC